MSAAVLQMDAAWQARARLSDRADDVRDRLAEALTETLVSEPLLLAGIASAGHREELRELLHTSVTRINSTVAGRGSRLCEYKLIAAIEAGREADRRIAQAAADYKAGHEYPDLLTMDWPDV